MDSLVELLHSSFADARPNAGKSTQSLITSATTGVLNNFTNNKKTSDELNINPGFPSMVRPHRKRSNNIKSVQSLATPAPISVTTLGTPATAYTTISSLTNSSNVNTAINLSSTTNMKSVKNNNTYYRLLPKDIVELDAEDELIIVIPAKRKGESVGVIEKRAKLQSKIHNIILQNFVFHVSEKEDVLPKYWNNHISLIEIT